jgi:hypothetical protein
VAGVAIGLSGDWRKAARILRVAPVRIRVALDRAVLQEAQFFRTKVVEGFREQAPGGQPFKPLAETTLALRRFKGFGGTKALMVRGDLRNSIKVVKKATAFGAEAFIGVHRTAKNKDGKSLVNIAAVHEFGSRPIVLEVTPAMRKFLAVVFNRELGGFGSGTGGTGGTGIIIIQIPARPFLQPVIDKYFNSLDSRLRFQARVAANLGGMMGVMGAIPGIPGLNSSRGRSLFSSVAQAIARTRGGPVRDP